MSTHYLLNNDEKEFLKLANFPLKLEESLLGYLSDFETVPDYKKIVNSMIEAKNLYQPLTSSSLYPDFGGDLREINEYRKFQQARFYMHKKDIINTTDEKGNKKLVVTSRGHKLFYEDYPLSRLQKDKWNGQLSVVMYDFPERLKVKREILRRKLITFGFGSPQISILVSPLPLSEAIQEFIEGEGLQKYVWVMKAYGIMGMLDDDVAKASWPIDELNDIYKIFLNVLPAIERLENVKALKKVWVKLVLAVISADPHLPKELLPPDWKGKRCKRKLSDFPLAQVFSSIF